MANKQGRENDLRQLFTDPIVDLDVFSEGVTVYTVSDVAGERKNYEVPNDPPFPKALALLRAYDEWVRLQQLLAPLVTRDNPRARAEERKLSARLPRCWDQLLKAFADLLSMRQEIGVEQLLEQFGAATMGDWIGTVILRIQMRRLGPDVERFIAELLSGEPDPKDGTTPTPSPGSGDTPSTTSSEPSDGSTGGPTASGGTSDGQSFGGPSKSSPGRSSRKKTASRTPSRPSKPTSPE